MKKRLGKSRHKGIAYLWMVMVLLLLIAVIGLSIDTAYAFLTAQQLQNAADASSLAGALLVRDNTVEARQAAIAMGLENAAALDPVRLSDNPGNVADGDVVIGWYNRGDRQFTPTLAGANAVKVVARRTADSLGGRVSLLFGGIFGTFDVSIERDAIAMIGGGTGSGIIMLNEEDKWTFRMDGTVTLDVRDSTSADGQGAIQVNSFDDWALKSGGSVTLLAGEINICAEDPRDPPEFDGDINTNVDPLPDPLRDIAPPPTSAWGDDQGGVVLSTGVAITYPPSPTTSSWLGIPITYISEGISMTGGTLTLEPGIYVLDGVGLNVTGGNLYAESVMFYIIDQTPGDSLESHVKLVGNGAVQISAMEEAEPYSGIAIWQARDNTNTADIAGSDQFDLDGTLYFPVAQVNIGGTSDSFSITQLIVDKLEISGSGTLFIDYDGRFPAPGTKVFLVE